MAGISWVRQRTSEHVVRSSTQEILDIAEAQTEAVVEPHGVVDDRRGKSVSMICGRMAVHRPSLPGFAST